MSQPSDFNQFAEPANKVGAKPIKRQRPGGLIAISVLALMLGSLGVLAVMGGVAGLVGSRFISEAIIDQAEANPEDEQLQINAKMQANSLRINRQYWLFHVVNLSFQCVVSIGLITAAIQVLRLAPTGRKMLLILMLITAVYEIARSYPTYQLQKANLDVLEDPEQLAGAVPDEDDSQRQVEMTRTMMRIAAFASMIFIFGWAAIKVVFYLCGAWYLSQPGIVSLFAKPEAEPAWGSGR